MILQRIQTSIAKKPFIFVFFPGDGVPWVAPQFMIMAFPGRTNLLYKG